MTKENTIEVKPWFTPEVAKQVRSNLQLRRAIEDYYGIKGYNTVNKWVIEKSDKLTNPGILKLISAYMKVEESELFNKN